MIEQASPPLSMLETRRQTERQAAPVNKTKAGAMQHDNSLIVIILKQKKGQKIQRKSMY